MTETPSSKIAEISNHLGTLADRISSLRVEELQAELRLAQVETQEVKGQLENALVTQRRLHSAINLMKDAERTLQERVEAAEEELRKKEEEKAALEAKTGEQRLRSNELEDEVEAIRQKLINLTSKCKANSQLLLEVFAKDVGVTGMVRTQILEQVGALEDRGLTINNLQKILGLYFEEFVKVILFLKNLAKEPREPKEASQKSLPASEQRPDRPVQPVEKKEMQIQTSKLNLSAIQKLRVSVAPENALTAPDKLATFSQHIKDIGEQIQFIRDKLEGTQKVEALEKYEALRQKYADLKQKKTDVEDRVKILENQMESKEKENQDQFQLLMRTLGNLRTVQGKDWEAKTQGVNRADFDRFKFETRFKAEFDDLKERLATRPVQGPDASVASRRDVSSSRKAGLDRLERVKMELLEKFAVEREDLQRQIQEHKKKIDDLRRDLKASQSDLHRKQVRTVSDGIGSMRNLGLSLVQDLRDELERQRQKAEFLQKNNQELTEKIIVFQNERVEIERKQASIDDLFLIFNQKATEVYLITEKARKILVENVRLRRFIEETFHSLFKLMKHYRETLGQANNDYGFTLEELQQVLFQAKGNPDFDPAVFRDLLIRGSQAVDAMGKRGKDDRGRPGESVSGGQSNYPAIEFRATAANDVDLLYRFNSTLVENLELKAQAEKKDKKITELSRDLLQYKKKVKTIAEIDDRVSSLVSQNANLKAALLELQSKAVEKTNEGAVRLSELNANVETSTHQLDLLIEANSQNLQVRRNLEKKASVLQAQLDTIRNGYEKRIADLEREIQGLKNVVEEKIANIAYLELENKKIEVQARRIRQLELDIEAAIRESEVKERTITLLKSNLDGLTQSTDKDSEKLSLEAARLREELTKEMHEKAENYVAKLAVEASLNEARSLLSEQQAQLKSWAEREREWSTRVESLADEIRELKMREGVALTTARQFKMEIEALEDQKRRYDAEYKQLRDRMEDVLERNNEIMVEERRRLATEIAKQFEEALLQREAETEGLRRELAELTFKVEGKDQEIAELKTRNETRTKQLLNFNKYISAVSGGKAAEKSETTFLVNQNKTLLGEVEGLRAAVVRLESRNRDILSKLEARETQATDQELAVKAKLAAAKKKAVVLQKGTSDAESLAILEMVRMFEEVVAAKETAISGLQNTVIIKENAAKEEKDRQADLQRQLQDKEAELKSLEERLAKLQTDLDRQKAIVQDIREPSRRVVQRPGRNSRPETPTVEESDGHFDDNQFDD